MLWDEMEVCQVSIMRPLQDEHSICHTHWINSEFRMNSGHNPMNFRTLY